MQFLVKFQLLFKSSKSTIYIIYADDANIIISGSNLDEVAQKKTNGICNLLVVWVAANGLSLNLTKRAT